jgi:hypothetical protein
VKLDVGAELEAADIADVELVGGTDLGRGRRMERGRDVRRESGSELAST